MITPLTVRQALVQCGLVPLEAQVLLAHVLRVERAWLRAHERTRWPPRRRRRSSRWRGAGATASPSPT